MLVEYGNIPVSLDAMLPDQETQLVCEITRACGLKEIASYKVLKRSIDARKKNNVHFILSVMVELPNKLPLASLKKRARKGVSVKAYEEPCELVIPDLSALAAESDYVRPIVVGAGPAGLFCALYLAKAKLKPIIIERGQCIEQRQVDVETFLSTGKLNENSNIQFGEGGAGAFSDGKLTTGTKSPLIRYVLEQFVACGAPDDILVEAHPHIGTDYLPHVVRSLRKRIEAEGGTFYFHTQLVDIETHEGNAPHTRQVKAACVKDVETGAMKTIPTNAIVLALGHSARDTYAMLGERDLTLERKPFAVGVRIEHPQDMINEAQYGCAAKHPALGAAEYKAAVHNKDGRGVYTFCMCPGGTVVAASSETEGVCVNGMSTHARDGENANSALLAEVLPEDLSGISPFAGIELQRHMEQCAYACAHTQRQAGDTDSSPHADTSAHAQHADYAAPAQTVGDFLAGSCGKESTLVTPSYPRGVAYVDLHACLPDFVASALEEALPALDRKIAGFAHPEALLTGVEARSSSPLRIKRDRDSLQSVDIAGLYPAGEGAGYAGGITSSAVDGIRCAQALAEYKEHA